MDHLPTSFSVLTAQGKVKVLRTEANVADFEELYALWQDPNTDTDAMELAVKDYLGIAQKDDPSSITIGDPR